MVNQSTSFAPFAMVYTKHLNLVMDLRQLLLDVTHKFTESMDEYIFELHKEVRERLVATNKKNIRTMLMNTVDSKLLM